MNHLFLFGKRHAIIKIQLKSDSTIDRLLLTFGRRACPGTPGAPYPCLEVFLKFSDMELRHVPSLLFLKFKHKIECLEFTSAPVKNQAVREVFPLL